MQFFFNYMKYYSNSVKNQNSGQIYVIKVEICCILIQHKFKFDYFEIWGQVPSKFNLINKIRKMRIFCILESFYQHYLKKGAIINSWRSES